MATVPLSGTNIRLLSGVPFSNDYKNTRWFDTQIAQTNYFLAKPTTHVASEHTFQRIEGRNFIRVKKHIDSLWGTNYVMFQNNDYNSKWFYGFVTKLEYVHKEATDVHFEIDVFQTWKFDMNFKPSFVVREHCPQWDSNGAPIINTVDEGLDYGTEYETVSVTNYSPNDDILFLVIVSKETIHTTPTVIKPSFNGMPQPLTYYIHPFRMVGGEPIVMVDGQTRSVSPINTALKGLMSNEQAVNNVVSIYVTEYPGNWVYNSGGAIDFNGGMVGAVQFADGTGENINTFYVKEMPTYASIQKNMGYKYNDLSLNVNEAKLLMYPYSVSYLDDFKGNRLVVKNEFVKGNDLQIRVRGSMGPTNKVVYSVDNYLVETNLPFDEMLSGSIEHALINNSPNDISIISDYLSAYLQGNRNQIENQKSAIMFNGTVGALTGGMVGMAQSTFARGGVIGANPVGVAAAGLQTVSGVGHAVIEMQGLQAKKQDINNTPAQLVKMGGNSAFDYGNGYRGVYLVKKQIKPEYIKKLTDFFNMFGYKLNEVKIPNFHTRQNWNYVQTSSCTILGNMNNEDLADLKNVFNNGITLWHTDDVGNYALQNDEVVI
jgi:hypothetical protein